PAWPIPGPRAHRARGVDHVGGQGAHQLMLSRRGLIGCFIAAPAIVRASSLMPVKAWLEGETEGGFLVEPERFSGLSVWWDEATDADLSQMGLERIGGIMFVGK